MMIALVASTIKIIKHLQLLSAELGVKCEAMRHRVIIISATAVICVVMVVYIQSDQSRNVASVNEAENAPLNKPTPPVRKEKPLNLSQLQNIYNERRRHVSDMCEKHKDDIGKNISLENIGSIPISNDNYY